MFFKPRPRVESTDKQLCNIARQLSVKAHREMKGGNDFAPVTVTLSAADFGYLTGYLESVTNITGEIK